MENTLNQFIAKLEGNEKKLVELLLERISLLEEERNLKDEIIRQKNQQLFANKQDLDYLYKVNRMLKTQNEEKDNYIEKLSKKYNGTTPVVDDGSGRELCFTKCGTASIIEDEVRINNKN